MSVGTTVSNAEYKQRREIDSTRRRRHLSDSVMLCVRPVNRATLIPEGPQVNGRSVEGGVI
jgi:hypothetical protein